MPGNEEQVAVDADFGSLQRANVVDTDGLHLPPVGARLIQLKQFLRPAAKAGDIHIGIINQIVIVERAAVPIITDVGQLLILVGLTVHRLLNQLPGENAPGGAAVIPAVDLVDLGLAVALAHDALPHVAGGAAESVGNG